MDKKKTLNLLLIFLGLLPLARIGADAQNPYRMQFFDRSYEYGIGNDSVKIFFSIYGQDEKRISALSSETFEQLANFYEDGRRIDGPVIRRLTSGVRIPKEYTFSILLDKSIPLDGKRQILNSLRQFVDTAADTCVFVSFYGDEVSDTYSINRSNFKSIEKEFLADSKGKSFYSGIHAKLSEFTSDSLSFISEIKARNYKPNELVGIRAAANPGKNLLMVFAEGSRRPDDENLNFITLTNYQSRNASALPKVYAFYYTADGEDTKIGNTLFGLTHPRDNDRNEIPGLAGKVKSSSSMDDVVEEFQTLIEDATYDYEMAYAAAPDRVYAGSVTYSANWGNRKIGEGIFTIGSAERPWPERERRTTSFLAEIFVALLVTFLTFAFFFFVMKILVPWGQSLVFKSKYYIKYQPEENVKRRICHYCTQEIRPGQMVVAKCSHIMHKHCWEENGHKCSEFGQNCSEGIQKHVEWSELFRFSTIMEYTRTIAGILAGLVSWIIYELCGRGGFRGLAEGIVGLVFSEEGAQASLIGDCVARTSSFLMIGLLLGFFLSLVFRYQDEIRDKTWKIWLKIIGLSCLTGVIGMAAFAVGADLFCLILSWTGKLYIPWYCSLPAYILFAVSVSLALTIKSSIPVKSALLGGLIAAAIGFLVLYFTKFTSQKYEWLNMLLAFIIYGGGLGASLITVRMLAEKYFLVIQNGIRSGLRIPIHKWMNATGGGKTVRIGMTRECEIQMTWEKSNKVAKEHAQLYIDHDKSVPVIKPLAPGVRYNSRAELPVNRPAILANGDTFTVGETIFKYEEV